MFNPIEKRKIKQLFQSIKYADISSLKRILDYGIDFDYTYYNGWLPISYAAWLGNESVFHFLVEERVKFDTKYSKEYLSKFEKCLSPFYLAAVAGNLGIVEFYLQQRYDIKYKYWSASTQNSDLEYIKSPFIITELARNKSLLELLQDYGKSNTAINLFDSNRQEDEESYPDHPTPSILRQAVRKNYNAIFEFLLENDSEIERKIVENSASLLRSAILNKNIQMMESLISHGADVNTASYSGSALHAAVETGDFLLVERLLYLGAKVNTHDEFKAQPLHYSVSIGDMRIMQLLLNSGSDINSLAEYGGTPLHYALSSKNSTAVKFLLKNGANLDLQDNQGITPFELAQKLRLKYCIKLINESKAKQK